MKNAFWKVSNFRPSGIVTGFVLLFAISVSAVSFYLSVKENRNANFAKAAVIDAEKLKNNATCFKTHEKTAKMLSEVISKIKVFEDKIKSEYEELKNNKKLTGEQRRRQATLIENKWTEISGKYNAEAQRVKDLDLKLSRYLNEKLNGVLHRLSRILNISVILTKETRDSVIVFYNSNNVDITNLVVRELNREVPTVDLKEISND